MSECRIVLVQRGQWSRAVDVTADGNVIILDIPIEIDVIDEDRLECETCGVTIHSGDTHKGLSLNKEWEYV